MKRFFPLILSLLILIVTFTGCADIGNVTPSASNTESTPISTANPSVTGHSNTTPDTDPETEPTSAPIPKVDPDLQIIMELSEQQRNSVEMLFYLNMVSQKIESSKNNRLYLEEVYSSLLNDTNPAAVDKKTQDHLQTILTIIKEYRQLELKRERLRYIYEQDKANSIKAAMPSPITVLSIAQSANWKKLVASVLYTAASSYTNYKSANDSLDKQFMLDGWELDDDETETIHKNRTRAFNYMVDIVRDYKLSKDFALNEDFINNFVDAISNENNNQKLQYLKSRKDIYAAFSPYWLELAKCYYELNDYQSSLLCLANYETIGSDIFRYDYQYAEFLPMAIVASQSVYANNKDQYVKVIEKYTNVLNSSYQTKWELKYFAAQSYMDLYAKTNKAEYLWEAYEIAKDNVNSLVKGQNSLNNTYLNDVQELKLSGSDIGLLSKEELKAQQKELDKLNKSLKEKRKTELPELYEPLVVNCELLFSLANELGIDSKEKDSISGILSGVFIVNPVVEKYSFVSDYKYSIEYSEDGLVIPANILTASSKISAVVSTGGGTISDFVINKVERTDSSISSFKAHYESKKLKSTDWKVGDTVTFTISNENYSKDIVFVFKVKEVKTGVWDWVKGVFGSDKVLFECVG